MTSFELKSYDELFGIDDTDSSSALEIPLDKIDTFNDHPFKVIDNEDMQQLVESVKINGIINPAIVREKAFGRYELISGHRRKRACELAGLKTLKCQVAELTDDEAVIFMVDSNLHRSDILPSEKAFSYKMRMEALKKQGKRTDLTSDQTGPKLRADEKIAKECNESATQIKRYIRLTYLIPELLAMVDEGKIKLQSAVELSFINKKQQTVLHRMIDSIKKYPSVKQAEILRGYASVNNLTEDTVSDVLVKKKSNKKKEIKIPLLTIREFFPDNFTEDEIIDEIYTMLSERKEFSK